MNWIEITSANTLQKNSSSLAATAVTHPIAIHATPSLSKDIIVIIVHDPLVAAALHDHVAHAEHHQDDILVLP